MSRQSDPNRLFLWTPPGGNTSLIIYKQRMIGQVSLKPVPTFAGLMDPPILLEKPFSERLKDRIRDLVNQRDGTNRNIVVREAPSRDHPAVVKYFEKKRSKLSW